MTKIKKTSRYFAIAFFILVLGLMSIACQYAGEIITSAEATQRALPSPTPTSDASIVSKFSEGDPAVVVGGDFGALVPLYTDPGGSIFTSQVMNNTAVTINGIRIVNENTWYQIEGMTGDGWIQEANLKSPE